MAEWSGTKSTDGWRDDSYAGARVRAPQCPGLVASKRFNRRSLPLFCAGSRWVSQSLADPFLVRLHTRSDKLHFDVKKTTRPGLTIPLDAAHRRQDPGTLESIMQRASILIVDDHPLVRSGLRELIKHEPDLEVCCEAASLQEAVELLGHYSPEVAIIDISLPDGSGLDLIKRLRIRNPDTRILVLSMHDETLLAERALRAGALGYINKEEAAMNIIAAIRADPQGKDLDEPAHDGAPAAHGCSQRTGIPRFAGRMPLQP